MFPPDKKLFIVTPCFNEEQSVISFYKTLKTVPVKIDKIVFADDGSTDATRERIKSIEDERVVCLAFPHAGKEKTLLAGTDFALAAGADFIATPDVDGQDPLELLPQLLEAVRDKNFELAGTRRRSRENGFSARKLLAGTAYFLAPLFCGIRLVSGARDFRVMPRETAEKICALPRGRLFLKGQIQAMRFKTFWLDFDFRERAAGTSRWSFPQLLLYTLAGALVTRRAVKSFRPSAGADPKK